jgi:hypothetical protein
MVDQLSVLYRRLVLWKEGAASGTDEHEVADPAARVA